MDKNKKYLMFHQTSAYKLDQETLSEMIHVISQYVNSFSNISFCPSKHSTKEKEYKSFSIYNGVYSNSIP